MSDLSLVEGGSERSDALVSKAVAIETASEGRMGTVSIGVSAVLTQRRTLWVGGALEVGDLCLLEDGSERRGALSSDVIFPETI